MEFLKSKIPQIGARKLRKWKRKFRLSYAQIRVRCRVDPSHRTERWHPKGRPPQYYWCAVNHRDKVGIDIIGHIPLSRYLRSRKRDELIPKENRIITEVERVLSSG